MKQQIIDAMRTFINQRPGLEYGNYGDRTSYQSEMRSITKDLHQDICLRAINGGRNNVTYSRKSFK